MDDSNFRFHDLRYTFTSHLVMVGEEISEQIVRLRRIRAAADKLQD
jgi:hypothetical protein